MMSSSTTWSLTTVKAITPCGCPSSVMTTPAAPLINTGRSTAAGLAPRRACRATASCAANDPGRSRAARAEVDSQDDVGVEHGDQCVEVTTASCQEEGIDHRTLTGEVGIWDLGAPYPTPCPARELPGGCRGSIDHGGDLLEWQIEHVMQNEGQPLSGSQGIEYDQERQADRVGKECLALWSKFSHRADDRIRETYLEGILAPDLACSEHVQTDAGDDRRQPSTKVLDVVRLGPTDSNPGVLDSVVSLGERAQHPIGDGSKLRPVLLRSALPAGRSRPSRTSSLKGRHGEPTTITDATTKEGLDLQPHWPGV